MEGSYRLPSTRVDTTIGLHGSTLNTIIVEDTFVPLDITSLTTSYGVDLRQPGYQTANQEAAVSIGFDYRKNKTTLLREPFNIYPASVEAERAVSVLRLSLEWVQRGHHRVRSLRSVFSN